MLSNWLQEWNNYYYQSFEWDSKDIKPRIIAEKLLEPSCGEIVDYKFYCYNGKCRHFLICKDRKTKTKYINYDLDFNCIKLSPNSYVADTKFEKNVLFDEMLAMAEKLSKPFPLVRVDFYDVDGKLYVGELTFSPGGGFNTYYEEWDNPQSRVCWTLPIYLPVQFVESIIQYYYCRYICGDDSSELLGDYSRHYPLLPTWLFITSIIIQIVLLIWGVSKILCYYSSYCIGRKTILGKREHGEITKDDEL